MVVYDPSVRTDCTIHYVKCVGKTGKFVSFEHVNGIRIKKKIRTCAWGEFVEFSTSKSKHTLVSFNVLILALDKIIG